ncbi:Bacteriophage CI repressor helix-turn-helix domain [Yokenella regensburgei]|nr:Bacteriophage CI repressor helix-turn-helix domain [Yokenella regensburgei]
MVSFANANHGGRENDLKGKPLYDEIMASGGKPVLRRILDAYGFTMQKELGDLLGISSGTISTWVRREFFPGDVVVTCALDTGASLAWLSTGKGSMWENKEAPAVSRPEINKFRLEAGELKPSGHWCPDPSMIPENHGELMYIDGVSSSWLVDKSASKSATGAGLSVSMVLSTYLTLFACRVIKSDCLTGRQSSSATSRTLRHPER